MLTDEVVELCDHLAYRPGWKITATDYTHRFEDSVKLEISIKGPDWSYPPDYDVIVDGVYNGVVLGVGRLNRHQVLREVFAHVERAESHENREAFRILIGDKWVAPFHPHTIEGITAWGHEDSDLHHALA